MLNELHLFSGVGGGILGGILLGHRCICAVEINPYCRTVLLQRQRDGILPWFPLWDDVRTFDGKPWRGLVDVLCAGFPCQKFSTIGNLHGSKKFNGWPDTFRIIGEVEPGLVYLENVPNILRGYWGKVLSDLAALGYDAEWDVFSCQDVSTEAPQIRQRVFALAKSRKYRLEETQSGLAEREEGRESTMPATADGATWAPWIPEPTIPNLVDGLAGYVGEVSAVGNGQVPIVAAMAFRTLAARLGI